MSPGGIIRRRDAAEADLPAIVEIYNASIPGADRGADAGFGRWGCLPRVAELDGVERDLVIVGLRIGDTPQ